MTSYYIRQGATSGDGTITAPFGSVAELQSSVTLVSGDTIFISNSSPLLEGVALFNIVDGLTIDVWDEEGDGSKWKKWNAELAVPSTLHATGSSFLVYKTSTPVSSSAINVTENWTDSDDGDGNRFGFLEPISTALGLQTNRGYFIDESDILYVSVPLGETTVGREYLVCIPGHGLQLSFCTNCVVKNGVVGLTTESGNGAGYGIRVTGDSSANSFINMEVDGVQYHGFGDVSNNPSHTLTNCIFRSHIRGTDSQYVVYSSNGVVSNCVVDGAIFWPVPWLDVDGEVFTSASSGGIKAIAAHHADDVDCSTAVGGILFTNCVQKPNTYLPAVHSQFMAIGNASSTNHPAPSDYDDVDTYPIIVRDSIITGPCYFGGGGKGSGNHQVNNTHIAFDRCQFLFDGSTSALPNTTYSGVVSSTCASLDADINCAVLLQSCTLSGIMNETSTTRLVFNRDNNAQTRMINCTLLSRGTTTATQRLIGVSASMGFLKFVNCIFDSEDSGNQLMAGGGVSSGWLGDPNRVTIKDNWYSTNLNTTFQGSFGINRTAWSTTIDPTGKYTDNPEFISTATLEPDSATRAFKNTNVRRGPNGINYDGNVGRYNKCYGAWQFGRKNSEPQEAPNRGVAGGWGLNASTVNRPNWLDNKTMASCILTRRGWETRLPGTGNPAQMEVIVAGNFGISSATNVGPAIYEGAYPLTKVLEGVSGAAIDPYFIEVIDPGKVLNGDTVTIGATIAVPSGLVVSEASSFNSPVQLFKITGTPTESGNGVFYIDFIDGGGSTAVAEINYNILA